MAALQPASGPARTAPRPRNTRRKAMLAAMVLLAGLWPGSRGEAGGVKGEGRGESASRILTTHHSTLNPQPAPLNPQPLTLNPQAARPDPYRATTSREARQNAVQAIPVEKLRAEDRAKVASVLSNISVFRRMPIGVIDCDPDLYLFMVQHPDVIVNIWEVLKISRLRVREIGPDTYQVTDSAGTLATVRFLYRSHDTHLVYAEGSYEGPLAARPVKGSCLMVLKTGYVRETDGRYYITSRLDTFLCVEPGGMELLAKAFQPLVGKVADNNFLQSVAFLGSLSRTAETNTPVVQRLTTKLANVQPELRHRLAELAAEVARKSAASSASKTGDLPRVAARKDTETTR